MTGDDVASLIAASAEGAAWAAEVAGLDGRGQTRAIIRAAADGPCLQLDMRLRCLQVRSLSDDGLTALVTTLPNLHRLGGASRYSDFALVAAHGELAARGRKDVLKSLHAVSGAVSESVARMLVDPPGDRRVAVQFQARSPFSPVTWGGR